MKFPGFLQGVTVLELAGLAPGPLCGQMLADYGARVIRIDRPATKGQVNVDQLTRGKESLALDLQSEQGKRILQKILANDRDEETNSGIPVIDVLIDTYRPGVLERLGLLPKQNALSLFRLNRPLVVARLTGYGQTGRPYAHYAGHDINYLAAAGILDITGPPGQPPTVPGNVLGDFAGLSLPAYASIVTALFAARTQRNNSTNGNSSSGGLMIVDVNIVESLRYLAQFATYAKHGPYDPAAPPSEQQEYPTIVPWNAPRGENVLEATICPYYTVYETADPGKYVTVGSLEPQFYAETLKLLFGDKGSSLPTRNNPANWTVLKSLFANKFKEFGIEYWTKKSEEFPNSCVMPVHELARPEQLPPAVVSSFISNQQQQQQQQHQQHQPVKGGFSLQPGLNSYSILNEFLGPNWRNEYGPGDYVTQWTGDSKL